MNSQSGGAERRIHDRVDAHVEIRFSEANQAARALRAYSLNFSAGGVCIRTKRPHALGEQMSLSMDVAGEHFDLKGVVAWVRGDAVGVRFEDLTALDQARLAEVLETLRGQGQSTR